MTSAFKWQQWCVRVVKLVVHTAAFEKEKQSHRAEICALEGVSDSLGLEKSKYLGLHKDSWSPNGTSERYAKPENRQFAWSPR